jgi:hypothetical protein
MKRTTTPDKHSERVKLAYVLLRTGVITPYRFSQRITEIWEKRHAQRT